MGGGGTQHPLVFSYVTLAMLLPFFLVFKKKIKIVPMSQDVARTSEVPCVPLFKIPMRNWVSWHTPVTMVLGEKSETDQF